MIKDFEDLVKNTFEGDLLATERLLMHLEQNEASEEQITALKRTINSFLNDKDAKNSASANKKQGVAWLLEGQLHFVKRRWSNEERKLAFRAFEKSHNLGNTFGTSKLGACYASGWGIEEDQQKAASLYGEAIEKDNYCASYDLGYCYQYGYGVKQDHKRAFELFKQAQEKGSVFCMHKVSYCYATAIGVAANSEQALHYYTLASEKGYVASITNIGVLHYCNGAPKAATPFWEEASRLNNADAHYNLARCVYEKTNITKAAKLYRRAFISGGPKMKGLRTVEEALRTLFSNNPSNLELGYHAALALRDVTWLNTTIGNRDSASQISEFIKKDKLLDTTTKQWLYLAINGLSLTSPSNKDEKYGLNTSLFLSSSDEKTPELFNIMTQQAVEQKYLFEIKTPTFTEVQNSNLHKELEFAFALKDVCKAEKKTETHYKAIADSLCNVDSDLYHNFKPLLMALPKDKITTWFDQELKRLEDLKKFSDVKALLLKLVIPKNVKFDQKEEGAKQPMTPLQDFIATQSDGSWGFKKKSTDSSATQTRYLKWLDKIENKLTPKSSAHVTGAMFGPANKSSNASKNGSATAAASHGSGLEFSDAFIASQPIKVNAGNSINR